MAEGATPTPKEGPSFIESVGIMKDALPAAGPILKWLADPKAPPLDAKTLKPDDVARFEKFATLFIGKVPQTKDEIKKFLEKPGTMDAVRNKAAEKPEMVVEFIQRMPPEQIAKLLKDNPNMMDELKGMVAKDMPTMTLASLFNKTVQGDSDVANILNASITDIGKSLKTLDTPKEIAEFFAALPPEYAKSFAEKFNNQQKNNKWFGLNTRIDPAKIEEGLQAALDETIWDSSYIREIQNGIQDTIEKFKPENLTEEKAAELIATYSKTENGKKRLMEMIAEGAPPKLKDKYKDMITPELLANADQSLVHNILTENIVSGMNSMKQFINGLPPGIKQFIAPLMEMAIGLVEQISPIANQLASSAPNIPGMSPSG